MKRISANLAAALVFACAPTAAFAHAQLEKATPAVGGTVTSAADSPHFQRRRRAEILQSLGDRPRRGRAARGREDETGDRLS